MCLKWRDTAEDVVILQHSWNRSSLTRVTHLTGSVLPFLQGASPEKSLQLQKTRIILDDEGIKRLEPGGHNYLQRTRRPRLPAAADALRRIRFRSSTEAPLKAD